ncbi:M20 family metallopeptidase [Microbacterium sp. NPDC077663]|uniref:M20 family metallopeptidase n=1 Tax=Microbacterium sp. NPDC077663 TaxID=3364189 RepID=UPI0037C896D9
MTTFDAVALRRDLHADPEIGLRLPRTVRRVRTALAPLRLEILDSRETSSFIAVIRGATTSEGARRAVLLRADMDALPVVEASGEAFASATEAMHACGHDLHTAALVGAAHALAARRADLAGDVALLFQAGEEALDGARLLVEEGLLDLVGAEWVAGFALHVLSDRPRGEIRSRAGAVTGSGTSVHAVFRGVGGHGATPHLAVDPIPALVGALGHIPVALSRGIDAHEAVVFTPGYVHAGTRRNVIPESAEFDATLRTFDPTVRERAVAIIERVCEGLAAAHGAAVDIAITQGYPSVIVDAAEHRFASAVAADVFGADLVGDAPRPAAMTEDFSRIAALMPSWFAFLGARPDGVADPAANHAATARFDDAVLGDAIELETRWAIERLRRAVERPRAATDPNTSLETR